MTDYFQAAMWPANHLFTAIWLAESATFQTSIWKSLELLDFSCLWSRALVVLNLSYMASRMANRKLKTVTGNKDDDVNKKFDGQDVYSELNVIICR